VQIDDVDTLFMLPDPAERSSDLGCRARWKTFEKALAKLSDTFATEIDGVTRRHKPRPLVNLVPTTSFRPHSGWCAVQPDLFVIQSRCG
jgi:hypothetical protein